MRASRRGQTIGDRNSGASVHIEEDRIDEVNGAIEALSHTAVMVGIPSDAEQPHYSDRQGTQPGSEARSDAPIGNATLGYIHEHGAPASNIPPRPWLRPGVVESEHQWQNYLRQAGDAAFHGQTQIMDRALHAAGIAAVSAIKGRITAGLSPPLKQSTVDARRARTPSRQATTPGDVKPLIDTGQFLNSISYVIRHDEE